MTAIGSDSVLGAFVLFCRIGSCLMLMPGFSSSRIPVNVRLFTALAVTLALTPLLLRQAAETLANDAPAALVRLFISEALTGTLIGFLARIFFGALETLSGVIAISIGLTSALAGPLDEGEPLPVITAFIMLAAASLIFFSDLHWEIPRGIAASYSVLPVSGLFDARFDLIQVTDCLTKSFLVALRISSPFIVYAIITNFAIGLASKLVPQIPIYFITVPAVIAGGLALFYLTCKPFMLIFIEALATWLSRG
ncbi:MAG: flagellar biosynthetic protein FliR [Beijerinckiaceae bacterium]|nr:flagellar biosynthetic protein FliR [Beijerinckiaceae bacterium]